MQSFLNKFRMRFGEINGRLESLEREVAELGMFLDLVVADNCYSEAPPTAMNSQIKRQILVKELFSLVDFERIIETGSFIGMTTAFLSHAFGVPVSTCEINERYFHVARTLLRDCKNVVISNSDSRSFLQ